MSCCQTLKGTKNVSEQKVRTSNVKENLKIALNSKVVNKNDSIIELIPI